MSVFDSADSAGEPFEVSTSPETAASDSAFEGANIARVGALSTMLGGDPDAIRPLRSELLSLGFSSHLAEGERLWQDRSQLQSLPDFREVRDVQGGFDRIALWQSLNEAGRPEDAVAFLVAVLGSGLERESAAAAAALWQEFGRTGSALPGGPRRWRMWDRLFDLWDEEWPAWPWFGAPWPPDPGGEGITIDDEETVRWDASQWAEIFQRAVARFGDPYSDLFLITILARWRIGRALRSQDGLTRSMAMAAFPPNDSTRNSSPPPTPPQPAVTPPGALVVSTMIHGTWGWKGDWWRPRSEFHEFILRNHRPNLFSRGAKLSWSGAYSDSQRELAGLDFCDWAKDVSPNGLQSVFAHSYGGEVAARALLAGARANELVLLSAPVSHHVEACARSDLRIVDIRLKFDPVLALARAKQRLPDRPNVTTVLLHQWRLDHGATHSELVWRDEDIATRGGL